MVARKTEDGKVSIRNVRRDTLEELRKMEKGGKMSEDDLRRFQDQLQKVTDAHIEQLEKIQHSKEQEIMSG